MDNWEHYRYSVNGITDTAILSCWKANTIADLMKSLSIEMEGIYDYDTSSGPLCYMSAVEERLSTAAIEERKTLFQPNDVQYEINEFGFRGKLDLTSKKPKLAVFGCSFSFGVGMPEDQIFAKRLATYYDYSLFNFGVPGGSLNRAVRYYSLISKFLKFDYVLFLVPHSGRFEVPFIQRDEKIKVTISNVIPNWIPEDHKEKSIAAKIYSALGQDYFNFDTIKNIDHAVTIARSQQSKIFFSSWDPKTYDLLYNYFGKDSPHLIPWFEMVEKRGSNDFARDGMHPGYRSHSSFFNRIVDKIK